MTTCIKTKGILTFLFSLFFLQASSQCPSGNIFLNTQAAINNFGASYPNCTHPTGDVYLTGADVWSFYPLAAITDIDGSLELNALGFINSLSDLNVVHIGGELRVTDNTLMSHLQGMDQLETIGEDLFVFNNPSLNSLNGLTGLESVNNIRLLFNSGIVDISELSGINQVAGYVHIIGMQGLQSLTGFEGLNSIPGEFRLESTGIHSLVGLNNLTTVMGNVSITGNPELTSMEGIGFQTLGGELVIQNNDSLLSLHEMNQVIQISDTLSIIGNALLSDCDAVAICDYLNFQGESVIEDNLAGCNTAVEIEVDCLVSSLENLETLKVSLFPNPATSAFKVVTDENLTLRLLDMNGRAVVLDQTNNRITIDHLPHGLYIVEVEGPVSAEHRKLVIQ